MNYVTATETITYLDLIFLCCSDILNTNNASKLNIHFAGINSDDRVTTHVFPRRQSQTVYDAYRYRSLQRRETDDMSNDKGRW